MTCSIAGSAPDASGAAPRSSACAPSARSGPMRRSGHVGTITLACLLAAPVARGQSLSSDQAVSAALVRNRDAIAARLEIDAAELDRVAAAIYPNPQFNYTLGNLVLGTANSQMMSP